MKTVQRKLRLWTIAAATAIALTACNDIADSPVVIPPGPEPDNYAFEEDKDPGVLPGNDFYQHVLGSWLEAHSGPDAYWEGTFADQYYRGVEWLESVLGTDSPNPVVADLYQRARQSADEVEGNIAALHAKTDAIAALGTREEVLTEIGRMMYLGYEPMMYTYFGGNADELMLCFMALPYTASDELEYKLQDLGFSPEEIERLLLLAADFFDYPVNGTEADRSLPRNLRTAKTRRSHTRPAGVPATIRSRRKHWNDPESARQAVPLLRAKTRTGGSDRKSAGELIVEGLGVDPQLVVLANEETEQLLTTIDTYADNAEGLEQLKAAMQLAVVMRDYYWVTAASEDYLTDIFVYDGYYPLIYQLNLLYVRQNISDEQIRYAATMGEEFRDAFADRLRRNNWLSEQTKARALEKLARLDFFFGCPDREDDRIIVQPHAAGGTLYEAMSDLYADFIHRIYDALPGSERTEDIHTMLLVEYLNWDAEATYVHDFNMTIIRASNLIEPVCDLTLGDAYNYAVLGATTLGHEMTHGFDGTGSNYDERGRLIEWWTEADRAAFNEKRQQMIDHMSQYEALPGLHLNGKATVDEDVADLGGLETALDIVRARCDSQGYSPEARDQQIRVFLQSFAEAWKTNDSDSFVARQLESDVHSPWRWRVNGPINCLDDWYSLFGVTSGQQLYVPADKRVHIW